MIVEYLVGLGCTIVSWLTSLLPSWDAPSWFTGFGASFNGFFANFDGFGAWADWTLIGAVLTAVLGSWLAVAAVRLLLFVYRLLPFTGGS